MAGSIRSFVGRKLTNEDYEKLTDVEKAEITEPNYSLRRFGWSPYTATHTDASGVKHKLGFQSYTEGSVQGVTHIVRSVLVIAGNSRHRITNLQKACEGPIQREVRDALGRLKNYRADTHMLGNTDPLFTLDTETLRFIMKNGNGQLIYKT